MTYTEENSADEMKLTTPTVMPRAKVHIQLIGSLGVQVEPGGPVVLPSRSAGWLLGILALLNGQPVDRERLSQWIWPESSGARALHNLRQTLAQLRRSLGDSKDLLARSSSRSVCLVADEHTSIDWVEFHQAAKLATHSSLQRAYDLYRGPTLDGCEIPIVLQFRDQLRREFIGVCDRLSESLASIQEFRLALDVLQRSDQVEPYRETTCRNLMRVHFEAGDVVSAIDTFQAFKRRMRDDLGLDLEPDTKQLFREIRGTLVSPPFPGAQTPRPSLPTPAGTLIGRKPQVKEIWDVFQRCRLVTLTGFGGVGKTRLAIALGNVANEQLADGAGFADFSSVQESHAIYDVILSALNMQAQPNRPPLDAIVDRMRGKEFLLICDNCEHLVEPLGEVIDLLLSVLPNLRILATSRQRLDVSGEYLWNVPSLNLPPMCVPLSDPAKAKRQAEGILSSDAARLFVSRMQPYRGTRELGIEEVQAVASICHRLEGMPLAIELAAARTKVLSVIEIDRRLGEQFSLLSGGSRGPRRHQTMEAAIDWSWTMLSAEESSLLLSLSIFSGGSFLEAIEETSEFGPSISTLDTLASLADKSLILIRKTPYGNRFGMLETIRQFAIEKLQSRNRYSELADRHSDYFLSWLEKSRPAPDSAQENHWFAKLELDHANFRFALDRCHSQKQFVKVLRFVTGLSRFWDTHGHLLEGLAQLERAIEGSPPDVAPKLLADARGNAGWMATVLHYCKLAQGHYAGALAYYRNQADPIATAFILNCLASATLISGEISLARRQFEEALEMFQAQKQAGGVSTVSNNLGEVALYEGDLVRARECFALSLAIDAERREGSLEQRGLVQRNLAVLELKEANLGLAMEHIRSALKLFRLASAVVAIPDAIQILGLIEGMSGNAIRAARLLGIASNLALSQGVPESKLLSQEHEEVVARLSLNLVEPVEEIGLESALDYALSLLDPYPAVHQQKLT